MKTLPKGHRSCLSPGFKYTPAAATDISRTFARLRRAAKESETRDQANAEEAARVVQPLRGARS